VVVREQLSLTGADGVRLAGEQAGEGTPIVLLHGLTATRRYVVMGSSVLERAGHRTISYDARGHGHSMPAPSAGAYTYDLLAEDLLGVLDSLGIGRATLAGASMGGHTAIRFALEHPERVCALGLITPSFDPEAQVRGPDTYAGWDALAVGLREGGVEGFVGAYDLASLPERWREIAEKVLRQRLASHEHPLAVADALQAVPRSRPFESFEDLERIDVPTLVVASRDEPDPSHPLAVGERYASAIAGATLAVENAGPPARSPLAWQGGQLSRLLAGLAAEAIARSRGS
jgi:pimeloyl-ACP methyl ester carboxylesterase